MNQPLTAQPPSEADIMNTMLGDLPSREEKIAALRAYVASQQAAKPAGTANPHARMYNCPRCGRKHMSNTDCLPSAASETGGATFESTQRMAEEIRQENQHALKASETGSEVTEALYQNIEDLQGQLTECQTEIAMRDRARLDWLETGPVLPLDASPQPGIEPECQRVRITRAVIDTAMQEAAMERQLDALQDVETEVLPAIDAAAQQAGKEATP